MNKSLDEISPEAWRLLHENTWLLPSIEKLDEVLTDMLNTLEEWKSLDVFEPLKQVVRGLLADCGITMANRGGSLHIWVNAGKVPL